MHQYPCRLRGLFFASGTCAALLGLAIAIPQEATAYLLGFVYSCIVIAVAVVLVWPADTILRRMPLLAAFPALLAIYFVLVSAFCLFGGAIEQVHLLFAGGNWLARRAGESALWGAHFAVVMGVLITLDVTMQVRRRDCGKDIAYYPRVGGLGKSLSLVQGRLVLIVGFLVLFGSYAVGAVGEWEARGTIRPPELAFATCVLGWAVLWIADCASRPNRRAVWVAIAFLLYSMLVLPSTAIVRE